MDFSRTFPGPEFRRHLWLDFSLLKIVAMPVLMVLIMVALDVFEDSDWPKEMMALSGGFFIVLSVIFGTIGAGNAMSEEMRDKTWDFQKMSAIGPWQLGLGKMLGASSYSWYGGLLSLGLFSFAYINHENQGPDSNLFLIVFAMTATALIMQSAAFFSSLQNGGRNKNHGLVCVALLSFIGFSVLSKIGSNLFGDITEGRVSFVDWYVFTVPMHGMLLYIMLLVLFWLIAGIYRTMREELMYQNTPIVWFSFIVTTTLFYSGFLMENASILASQVSIIAIVGTALSVAALYWTGLAEASSHNKYLRFWNAIKGRDWRRAALNCPKTVVSAFLTLAFYGTLAVLTLMIMDTLPISQSFKLTASRPDSLLFVMTACILLTVRDLLFFNGIMALPAGRHKFFALVVYYMMAYGLLPLLADKMFDSDALVSAFYPIGLHWGIMLASHALSIGAILAGFYIHGLEAAKKRLEAALVQNS